MLCGRHREGALQEWPPHQGILKFCLKLTFADIWPGLQVYFHIAHVRNRSLYQFLHERSTTPKAIKEECRCHAFKCGLSDWNATGYPSFHCLCCFAGMFCVCLDLRDS